MTFLEAAKIKSQDKITELRKILATEDSTFTIIVVGSLARGEASDESDIDYYFFGDDDASVTRATAFLKSKHEDIAAIVGKQPSAEGAFGSSACETHAALVKDIGGGKDSNAKITRRILFLLEGTWLTSQETFLKYRNAVLIRYVSEFIEPHHLCRFLLNDIIRYYRTICVDFEFKTVEGNKEWGLRYIKLRYSRQLLYFSGLMAVAETVGLTHDDKLRKLVELFDMSPTDRILFICGNSATHALNLYDNFLGKISSPEIRTALEKVAVERSSHTDEFKELQSKGREFTISLASILTEMYDRDHVIHNALIF
jgi:predicted nucleotidyltransferase